MSLNGYHPWVRDFILGQGMFSSEAEAKMHADVAAKACAMMMKTFREAMYKSFSDLDAEPAAVCPVFSGQAASTESAPAATGTEQLKGGRPLREMIADEVEVAICVGRNSSIGSVRHLAQSAATAIVSMIPPPAPAGDLRA